MKNKYKILIIEDQPYIRDILSYSLVEEGYEAIEAEYGKLGIELCDNRNPDLVLLDLMLPDMDGYEVCKRISVKHKIPIIMLTAKNNIVDKILGLELGADDYITKPFDIREVLVRIKVALRRIEETHIKRDEKVIYINNKIKLDKACHVVYKNEDTVKLKPKEYELLLILAENRGIAFSRDKLIEKVWGYDFDGDERTVDVHVQRLRSKLDDKKEESNSIIETVFGTGYKLI